MAEQLRGPASDSQRQDRARTSAPDGRRSVLAATALLPVLPTYRSAVSVLSPSDELRYSPGSLLVIVSASAVERDRFAERLIDSRTLLSLDKVRTLLAGRVDEEEIASRAQEVLDAAVVKRLEANQTVTIAAEGLEAGRARALRADGPRRQSARGT